MGKMREIGESGGIGFAANLAPDRSLLPILACNRGPSDDTAAHPPRALYELGEGTGCALTAT